VPHFKAFAGCGPPTWTVASKPGLEGWEKSWSGGLETNVWQVGSVVVVEFLVMSWEQSLSKGPSSFWVTANLAWCLQFADSDSEITAASASKPAHMSLLPKLLSDLYNSRDPVGMGLGDFLVCPLKLRHSYLNNRTFLQITAQLLLGQKIQNRARVINLSAHTTNDLHPESDIKPKTE